MQATIKYRYNSAGQRASLIAGGDGKIDQMMVVDVSGEDLALLDVTNAGQLTGDATKTWQIQGTKPWQLQGLGSQYLDQQMHEFSSVPSPVDLVVFLRERAAQKELLTAEIEAKKTADAEADRTEKEDRRREQSALIDADLAGTEAYAPSSNRYYCLASEDPRRALMGARWEAKRAADAAKEARVKTVQATRVAKPRWTTLLADGSYEFSVPVPSACDWAKHVTSIDSAAKNGYAFEGDWAPKPGQTAYLPVGELLLVGGKYWSGSRKRGDWAHAKHLYIVTAAGIRLLADDEKCKSVAITYLALSPAERVEKVLKHTIKDAKGCIATLDALDATEYADCATEIAERRDAWVALRDAAQKVLDAAPANENITDVDSAAAAIVSAGFRLLSKTHHPDAGGNAETMALLSQARQQLREMLTLAGGVR